MFSVLDISIFDFLSQLLGFAGFLRILNSTALISSFEISGFFLPLFLFDEDAVTETSFFFNQLNFNLSENFLKSPYSSVLPNENFFDNFLCVDFLPIDDFFSYFNFTTFDYDLEYEIFDLVSFFLILVLIFFTCRFNFFISPQDDIVLFLSLVGAALTSGDDLFTLFLGFELLTIILVLFMALDYRRFGYNKNIILYYLLSVVVSLIIFFFFFLIFFIVLPFNNAGFINFYTFSLVVIELLHDNLFNFINLSFSVKFFFLNLCVLFMFKYTLGPAAFWVVYLYPAFPIFILIVQMVFLKYNLFFLFFEFFDFIFFYPVSELAFLIQSLSVILLISLFFGSFVYKINNLKLLLTITSFSQVGYVCVSYISPSFVLTSYSLNYLTIYLSSLFLILVLLLLCNIFFNIQYLHELKYLRHYDSALFFTLLLLFCSLAGLPPLLGFFAKYFLLLKLLTTPYLFYFGVSLSIVSFLTLYVYLSAAYSLIKYPHFPAPALVVNTTLVHNSFLLTPIMAFLGAAILYLLCFFLMSPFLSFFSSSTFFFFFF